jgi:4-hydroxy-tetrahydrodipicolinate synthase
MTGTPLFRGVGVALVTLFGEEGELAAGATAEHAARLAAAGMQAVLVAGSTGEAATLEAGERITLLEAVREAVPPAVPVIAGTGAPSARQAASLTAAACDHGADAVLVLSPPYASDPRPYYDTVAKAAGATPVLAYHFPRMSPPGIAVEDLFDLPVSGCKDSSGDPSRLLRTVPRFDGALWTGSPLLTLLAGVVGAAGALLALANLEPEACQAAWGGDVAAQQELADLHEATTPRFPAELKARLAQRYATPATARLL